MDKHRLLLHRMPRTYSEPISRPRTLSESSSNFNSVTPPDSPTRAMVFTLQLVLIRDHSFFSPISLPRTWTIWWVFLPTQSPLLFLAPTVTTTRSALPTRRGRWSIAGAVWCLKADLFLTMTTKWISTMTWQCDPGHPASTPLILMNWKFLLANLFLAW